MTDPVKAASAHTHRQTVNAEEYARLEQNYRQSMSVEMQRGEFLNEHTTDDEWAEPLSTIFACSYTYNDEDLAGLVRSLRYCMIKRHAARKAEADMENR